MSDEDISKAVADEHERQKEDAEVRATKHRSSYSRVAVLCCLGRPVRREGKVGQQEPHPCAFRHAPFLDTTLPGQVRAIALERNELEALLFDMNSAPNKKHGELLDKCVSGAVCVCACACVCVWPLCRMS